MITQNEEVSVTYLEAPEFGDSLFNVFSVRYWILCGQHEIESGVNKLHKTQAVNLQKVLIGMHSTNKQMSSPEETRKQSLNTVTSQLSALPGD